MPKCRSKKFESQREFVVLSVEGFESSKNRIKIIIINRKSEIVCHQKYTTLEAIKNDEKYGTK